jgi:hypothetical protein
MTDIQDLERQLVAWQSRALDAEKALRVAERALKELERLGYMDNSLVPGVPDAGMKPIHGSNHQT